MTSAAADGIIDLYSRRATDFDIDRTKTLFEKVWLDAFLSHVPPGSSILDLGCGSGEVRAPARVFPSTRFTRFFDESTVRPS